MMLEEQQIKKEKFSQILIQLQQGIEHMYKKMNFVKPEEEDMNFNQDEPPMIRLIKNLNQKLKLTFEVVKKKSKYQEVC